MKTLIFILLFFISMISLSQANSYFYFPELNQFCPQNTKSITDSDIFFNKEIYGQIKKCTTHISASKILDNLKNLNFKIQESPEEINAYKDINKKSTLWLRFDKQNSNITVLSQYILIPNTPLEIEIKENKTQYFYIKHNKDSFLSLTLDLPAKTVVNISCELKIYKGKFKKHIFYSKQCDSERSKKYILYNIPQDPGLYLWKVELEDAQTDKAKLRIISQQEAKLTPIALGDKVGGILIKNITNKKVTAVPDEGLDYVDIQYPYLSTIPVKADTTSKGNALFWLPAGRWTLRSHPLSKTEQSTLNSLEAHLIPVFPGHLTIVKWPLTTGEISFNNHQEKLKILKTSIGKKKAYLDFALFNLKEKNIKPTLKEFQIQEGSSYGKALSLERIKTPLDIVILLDSSGSMKKSIKDALKATSDFLHSLPSNANITLIDFDNSPKILKKGTPKQILDSLSQVKANGATALYDAISLGLKELSKANRPALIIFTDGKDSNYNDSGPGSKTTKTEIWDMVRAAHLPLFCIGFGKNPDVETLSRLASLSGGNYYKALNKKALSQVFRKIKANLGHQWRLTYKRPVQVSTEKPVFALVVDNSGSMNMSPEECDGCNYRLEKVKQILKNFIQNIPSKTLMQLFIFSDYVVVKQVLTDNKAALLRGLSEMKELGGTNILESIRAAYTFLHSVTSNQKYLIYITDAALKVETSKQAELNLILQKIKDDRIKSLWIGMLDKDKDNVFAKTAKLSAGESIVAPTTTSLDKTLKKLNQNINSLSPNNKQFVRLTYKHTTKLGKVYLLSDGTLVETVQTKTNNEQRSLEGIIWEKGEQLAPYTGKVAKFITGNALIGKEALVSKRIPLNISSKNKAVEITLKEAIFFSKLNGLTPPPGKRFLAFITTLKNILPAQKVIIYPNGSSYPASWMSGNNRQAGKTVFKKPDYLIPNAKLHFFLRWNNQQNIPLSKATYLANTPLILPDDNSIYLSPQKLIKGTFIFIVPDNFMEQSSLHFYDTAYGHIDLPISGIIKQTKEQIKKLPHKVKGKLSTTFSIHIKGSIDKTKIQNITASKGNVFRILDCVLTSKIQAHLAINPKKRLFLSISTNNGDFFFKLHPLTQTIPYGLYTSRLITPGSYNRLRLLFEIPKGLAKLPASLVIDLKGGPVILPLTPKHSSTKPSYQLKINNKSATLFINNIYLLNSFKEFSSGLLLDISLKNNLNATTTFENVLSLKLTPSAKKRLSKLGIKIKKQKHTESKGLASFGQNMSGSKIGDIFPSEFPEYLLGLTSNSLVFRSQKRRGFIFFDLPPKTFPKDWVITSPIFGNLKQQITQPSKFKERNLLTTYTNYSKDNEDFDTKLSELIENITQKRHAQNFIKPGKQAPCSATTLDGTAPQGTNISPPSQLLAGGETWKQIDSLDKLKSTLRELKFVPSQKSPWQIVFSPEAVFTQKWYTENEAAYMAELILNKKGIETIRKKALLSNKGKQSLRKIANTNISLSEEYSVPIVEYIDKNGKHSLIFPFFKEEKKISSFIKNTKKDISSDIPNVNIEILVEAKSCLSSEQQSLKDITDALGSGEQNDLQQFILLNQDINLKDTSLDCLDLGFIETIEPNKGKVIKAILDSPLGRKIGQQSLILSEYQPVSITINISLPNSTYTTTRYLDPKTSLNHLFFVLGINSPDLPQESIQKLNKYWHKKHSSTKKPNIISSLKWLGRGIIYRFIGAQTKYELNLTNKLGLYLSRANHPRILVVTAKLNENGQVNTSLDLVQPYPKIYGQENKIHTFNILAGLFYTSLEAKAVPKGLSALNLLSCLPKQSQLILIPQNSISEFIEILKQKKYPYKILNHFKNTQNYILFPSIPLQVNNKYRTAWFEIDPYNYKVMSYLDSGEKGAVETVVSQDITMITDYMVGAWVGLQVSVWSNAGFSLMLDDYKEIQLQAHNFARQMAAVLYQHPSDIKSFAYNSWKINKELNFKYQNFTKEELTKSFAQDGWTSGDIRDLAIDPASWNKKLGDKELELGFARGFKDAVDWYFEH
ncbi:von Willebrand factor type A domain-containing protein [Desulfonauticus submarinus]|uniref:von Willebrand factor type A domain-containing protein n=1 Tax=Desulfonauticus submarinus TaxID=206665 RepID=A0A1H0DGV2_9BACT|nr:VWA domain-containing protein [Desulfonauticus submarinus]SDN69343.1 von Willebrand factor type A domain-containing protein [Desulfonauticus submarinus]